MSFDIVSALFALSTMMIPGLAAGYALLYGMKFSRIEKAIIGMILSITLIPTLMFMEFVTLGILFNLSLYLANVLLVLLASGVVYYYQAGTIKPNVSMPKSKTVWDGFKRYGPIAFVLAAMLVGAYVRFAPAVQTNGGFNTAFYEFDPYYYMKLTERLVQNGQISLYTDDSYFPQNQFQRWPPLSQYMTGSWLLVYDSLTGQPYSQNNMIFVSDFYPPLVAAFMCFIAFMLIREEYNAYFAAIGAAMFALTPQLIQKFAYGETLEQPFGVYLALLFFGLLLLSLKRNSFRLGLLTCLTAMASVFGSQQYVWPFIMFYVFLAVMSMLYFLSNGFSLRKWVILFSVGAIFLISHTIMAVYDGQNLFRFIDSSTMILLASMALSTVLFFIGGHLNKKTNSTGVRLKVLGGVLLAGLLIFALTPLGPSLVKSFYSVASESTSGSQVSKTIAEEGSPTPAMYPQTFGVLDPRPLLLLTAVLPLMSASILLFRKKHEKFGGALLGAGLLLILVKGWINNFFSSNLNAAQFSLTKVILLLITNDTSVYVLIGLFSCALIYLLEEEKNRSEFLILMTLVIYPVVFIGSNRLKFLLHMSVALALTLPLVLGEMQKLLEQLNDWFKVFTNHVALRTGVIGLLMVSGLFATVVQAQYVPFNMTQLAQTSLPQDWQDAYTWVRTSSPADLRMMSWWDYGHWTTFLGHRKTVLNPSNVKDYDQGVARAFVDSNPNNLYDLMEYHNATHILVDGDLIGKWGALVFLSGTCQYSNDTATNNRFICPKVPEIDLSNSPGQSKYEVEHYFEQLQVVGTCPASSIGVPLPLLQSTFGAKYCLTNDQMLFVSSNGQISNVTRPYKMAGRDAITGFDPNTSYLFATGVDANGQPSTFININPYFEPFGLHNDVFNSPYTRLFFLKSYPGFKLVYDSPSSYVKIFEYTGRPSASASAVQPTPLVTEPSSGTPTPTVAPSISNASGSKVSKPVLANAT